MRTLLAVAFLLFLVTIGCGNLLYSHLFFHKDDYFSEDTEAGFQKPTGIYKAQAPFETVLHLCNLAISSVLFAAFFVLAIVVSAFAETVGWITVATIGVFVLVYLYIWFKKL